MTKCNFYLPQKLVLLNVLNIKSYNLTEAREVVLSTAACKLVQVVGLNRSNETRNLKFCY